MADMNQKVLEIRVKIDEALKKLVEYDEMLKQCAKSERALKIAQKSELKGVKDKQQRIDIERKYAAELKGVAEQEKAVKDARKQVSNQIQNEIKFQTQLNGSLNQLRANLKNLVAQYDKLSKAQRQGDDGQKLRKQIRQLTEEIKKAEMATGRFGRNVGNYMSAFKGLWKTVGVQMIGGFLGTAQAFVALGNAIKDGIETALMFNRSVSKLAAILQKSSSEMGMLTAQAKELGATTRYTAQEVVSLQTELAKLGYSESQIMQMTKGVLLLAQSTGSDLADAASLAGAALRMFELSANHTMEIVDQMALATSKSALSFDYIKTALPIVGSVAHTFNFSLRETLSLLGQLANAGFEASMAATATRNIFLNLADSNGELAKQLGKPIRNINELADALVELKERGVNLNDTLQLTDKRSVAAFNAFLRGAKGAKELAEALLEADGTAAKMAETMEDNLGGEITRLKSAWDDFLISLNGSQGVFKNVVKGLRDFVSALGAAIRSNEEAQNIRSMDFAQELSQPTDPTFKRWTESDIKLYESKLKEFLDNGQDQKDAMQNAYNVVFDGIKKDESDFRAAADSLSKERKMLERAVEYYHNKGDELHLESIISEETINRASEIAQASRLNAFDDYIKSLEKPAEGIPVEDGSAKNKRNNLEKRIAKARLDAEKSLQNDLLKLANEGADKRRYAIELKYEEEIETVRYKLNEELRVLEEEANNTPNLSQKAWDDLAAAKEAYQVMLEEQIGVIERLRDKELKILDAKEVERELSESVKLNKKFLEGMLEDTEEYYDLKSTLLELELAQEIAQLEQRFISEEELTKEQRDELQKMREKDIAETKVMDRAEEMLEEQKCERLLAINKSYIKKREELYYKALKARQARQMDSLLSEALDHKYDDSTSSARYGLKQAELSASQVTKAPGESQESFVLRQKQANDAVLQARKRLSEAMIEADLHEAEIAQTKARTEIDALRATAEYRKKYSDQVIQQGKFEAETTEEYEKRKELAAKESFEAQLAYSDALFERWSSTAESIATFFGAVSDAIQQSSKENEKNVRRAKILGLAQIYINQAVAIAAAIKDAAQSSITVYDMIAKIGVAVTTVVASTAQAISSIKKAKFAKGGVDIQGPGTSTSDSIDARLSKGESVMTARATAMWKPILIAMNEIASKPNVTLPTQYSRYNPLQTMADSTQMGDTMREVVRDIHPVVSVTEIEEVSNRLQRVRALDNI